MESYFQIKILGNIFGKITVCGNLVGSLGDQPCHWKKSFRACEMLSKNLKRALFK